MTIALTRRESVGPLNPANSGLFEDPLESASARFMTNYDQHSVSHANHDEVTQPTNLPARREAPVRRNLLERILDTPQLAQVVPNLKPELLHQIIKRCGLEDCSEIVGLATPEQLMRVFDLDLWRAVRPGLDEKFDADRFGVWLEVLLEAGAAVAAQKLAGMDIDLVVAGLAHHVLVYDRGAVTPYETLDGELVTFYADAISAFDIGLTFDFGGYLLMAKRAESWEAIIEVLTSLAAGHPDYLHQVMRGCVTLSNSGFELDGLDDLLAKGDQSMYDLGGNREGRRERQGFVSLAEARAFLKMSRELQLESHTRPTANPLTSAYFRTLNETTTADADKASNSPELPAVEADAPLPSEDSAKAVDAVMEILHDAGVIAPPPRALLGTPETGTPRRNQIQRQLEFALDQNYSAYLMRNEELGYLANVLLSGCSIQERPFTPQEASDAAVAICNLGLENWPSHWLTAGETSLPAAFLIDQDLVGVFQVGWKVLHEQVGRFAAKQLIQTLDQLRCDDRETQIELIGLRLKLAKSCQAGEPWRARKALDVIMILDTPAWAVLLALFDECPTLHAIIAKSRDSRTGSVYTSDFEFIAENRQIESVHEFLRSLPETLSS